MSAAEQNLSLDKADHALIRELSGQPELTNKALAARLGIAESTCAYRLRRLRRAGVVGRARLDLDHTQLGYALQAVIVVTMTSHSRADVNRFMEALEHTPHVLRILNLTGRSDFFVTVAVRDSRQLQDLVLDRITRHPAVRSTETHIVFEERRGTWVPGGE
ncbi:MULTISPECIES: Lrp/AsnC family transcriptional regulator [Brevibacterium]|uniref:HTH asnC-type domain-containing protein n=1 Tax=Brevibacterium salitolerans TaxID=1403566 RepID=A0ABN2WSL2_9MICO|nr:Lrp/AsnC family transcriptional regulator [Brevibacterium sp.]